MTRSKYLAWAGIMLFISMFFISWTGRHENSPAIPVDYYKLDNGLKVVLSQDKTAPIIAVGVY